MQVQRLVGPGATAWGTCWAERGQRGLSRAEPCSPASACSRIPESCIPGGGWGSHTLGCREGARSTSDWGGGAAAACLPGQEGKFWKPE